MSDNGEDEEDEPVVELGDGDDVEGAPVSRVASRLFFPIEKSEVVRREGGATIRTPDGARSVEAVLDRSDEVYFETNQDFVAAVRSVVGTGPVPTVGGGSEANEGSDSGGASAVDDATTGSDEGGDATTGSGEGGDAGGGEAEGGDAEDGEAEDSEFEFDEE